MTKINKSKLSQEMIDERNIARAKQQIAALGLNPDDIMPKLQAKMGSLAADFVTQAMRYPGYLCNRTGEPFQKSKALIQTYANEDISDERLAKALGASTAKEVTAKIAKLQESSTKYKIEQDMAALQNTSVTAVQTDAARKQEQTSSYIDRKAVSRDQQAAVLTPKQKDQSAVLKPTTKQTEQQQETSVETPAFTGFKLEPVSNMPYESTWGNSTPSATAPEEPIPLDSRRIAEAEAKAKAAATEPVIENILETDAREKAQEELARLKNGKEGELTLAELTKAGISDANMESVVTMDNISEIHAGKSAMKSAKAAPNFHRRTGCARNVRLALEAGGFKGSTYDPSKKITSGKYRGNVENGTTQCRTLRNKDGFYTFEFDCNPNGNPEIANLKEPGTYIGWEAKPDSIEPRGHGAIMDTHGVWHGGLKQDAEYMSSSAPAKRYKSDTYTVGFFGDCTVSDKLAEEMLYQKYLTQEQEKITPSNTNTQVAMTQVYTR